MGDRATNAADESTIHEDIACIGCGYNLRTLRWSAKCPECNRPVAVSERAHIVRSSELGQVRVRGTAWLLAMQRGLALAIFASFASLVGLLYRHPQAPVHPPFWVGFVWLLPFITVFVMSCWAAWKLATPATRPAPFSSLLRSMVILTLVALAFSYVNGSFFRYYFNMNGDRASAIAERLPFRPLGGTILVAWPCMVGLTFRKLTKIAWLCGRRGIAIEMGIAGLLATTFALGACMSGGPRVASGDLTTALIGPTGSFPLVWLAVRFSASMQFRNELILIAAAAVTVAVWLGVALVQLHATITRAILLGGLPDPNSPPSPSTRPPA